MSVLGSSEFSSIHLSISWVNVLLYVLEIILFMHYFTRFSTPIKRPLKMLLIGMLLADTICMITVFATTWLLLIKGPQSYSIGEYRWTVLLSTLMITTVSVIEEVFLINRCRRLAQHTAITSILLALVIAHAVFNIYSGFYVVTSPSMASTATGYDTFTRRYGSKAAAILASIAATVDVLVPLALIWRIFQVTPEQVSKKRSWMDTIINSISSGGIGGLMCFVLLILFWVRPDVFFVLNLTMGRVYVSTLLVNLIVSQRKTSPYDIPDNMQIRKMSISAEILTMTSFMTRLGDSMSREKQLPPTPSEAEEV